MEEDILAIAILHGIGIHNKEDNNYFNFPQQKIQNKKTSKKSRRNIKTFISEIDQVKQEFEASILKSSVDSIEKLITSLQTQYTKSGGKKKLIFKPIFWGDEIQQQKELLWSIYNKLDLGDKLFRKLFIYYLGDIFAYQPLEEKDCFYDQIQQKFHQGLIELAKEAGSNAPLCVIAHSLGSVITADYFVKLQQGKIPKEKENALVSGDTFQYFYTLGSPLALYSLRYLTNIKKSTNNLQNSTIFPFGIPVNVPIWRNFYDKNDIIAYPVKELNDLYRQSTVQDILVEAGNKFVSKTMISHTKYWTTDKVINTIVDDFLK